MLPYCIGLYSARYSIAHAAFYFLSVNENLTSGGFRLNLSDVTLKFLTTSNIELLTFKIFMANTQACLRPISISNSECLVRLTQQIATSTPKGKGKVHRSRIIIYVS
jgi:hypothetical protein